MYTINQGTHPNLSVTHKWIPTQCLGNSDLTPMIDAEKMLSKQRLLSQNVEQIPQRLLFVSGEIENHTDSGHQQNTAIQLF